MEEAPLEERTLGDYWDLLSNQTYEWNQGGEIRDLADLIESHTDPLTGEKFNEQTPVSHMLAFYEKGKFFRGNTPEFKAINQIITGEWEGGKTDTIPFEPPPNYEPVTTTKVSELPLDIVSEGAAEELGIVNEGYSAEEAIRISRREGKAQVAEGIRERVQMYENLISKKSLSNPIERGKLVRKR